MNQHLLGEISKLFTKCFFSNDIPKNNWHIFFFLIYINWKVTVAGALALQIHNTYVAMF